MTKLKRSKTMPNMFPGPFPSKLEALNFFDNVHYRLIIVADDQAHSSLMKNCDLASAGRRTHATIPLVYERTNLSKF